uniref:protein ADM2 isoform X3 n=1 Tax=Callithrix jacchus TaxID=9483 RepID=UPI0023DCF40F|nr:protein ADM2 isoform X3 [Callithrix jacchus]
MDSPLWNSTDSLVGPWVHRFRPWRVGPPGLGKWPQSAPALGSARMTARPPELRFSLGKSGPRGLGAASPREGAGVRLVPRHPGRSPSAPNGIRTLHRPFAAPAEEDHAAAAPLPAPEGGRACGGRGGPAQSARPAPPLAGKATYSALEVPSRAVTPLQVGPPTCPARSACDPTRGRPQTLCQSRARGLRPDGRPCPATTPTPGDPRPRRAPRGAGGGGGSPLRLPQPIWLTATSLAALPAMARIPTAALGCISLLCLQLPSVLSRSLGGDRRPVKPRELPARTSSSLQPSHPAPRPVIRNLHQALQPQRDPR